MGVLIQLSDRIDLEVKTRSSATEAYLGRLAPGSRRTMRQALRYMAQEFSGGTHDEVTFEWAGLRYEHTTRMRGSLATRYAPATANKMLCALRGVLTECWRLGQMDVESLARAKDVEPVHGTKMPKGRCLSRDEVQRLMDQTLNLDHAKLIMLMVTTGLRRAEASQLRWKHVSDNALLVKGKGGKERVVPVPAKVFNLTLWRSRLPTVVEPEDRIFPVSPGRIWHILREAAFRAGIPPLSPHDLRRTYATTMLAAGKDLSTVQRLMGHSNPKTTAGYDRRGAEDDAKAVEDVWGTL